MDKLSGLKDALEFLETTEFYGEWDSALIGGENGKNYHAVINANDVVVRAADDSRHTSWLCDYLEAVSPVKIRALLVELEAANKREDGYREKWVTELSNLQDAGKRIAELEGQLQSGFTPEALAQEERAESAEQRVAELKAKLATPVRLLGEMIVHDLEHRVERQAAFEHRKIAWDARLEEDKKAILAAGFTFTVEGDE